MNSRYVNGKTISILVFATLIVLLAFGVYRVSTGQPDPIGADTVVIPLQSDPQGFAQPIDPWQWEFPRDHGPHPQFQTEWWYFTGNVVSADGRRFGYQFTIFRRALTPEQREANSEWQTNQVYLAHFTVSDIDGKAFYQEERFSRGAAGLAGATTSPRFHVWLEDWSVEATDASALHMHIRAKTDGFAIDLELKATKPPALHGDNGLSQKGPESGNASYYYSLTRLDTSGTVEVGDKAFAVSGLSWMDREFSTSALGAGAVGWDWFALQLSDGRDLMVGQIRQQDGSVEPRYGGLLALPNGETRYLSAGQLSIEPLGTWKSKTSGAVYPAGWEVVVRIEEETLRLLLEPLLANQEVVGRVTYWEGAIRISGDAQGFGYAELTGYAQPMQGLI
jgi:predicted secreted hydrolase